MEIIKIEPIKSSFISIAWYLGSVCNYKCSYCNPIFHDCKEQFPDDYAPFFKFIDKLHEKYPEKIIALSLFGGEVTIWNKIDSFLEKCKQKNVMVRLVTNGTKNLDWWKKNINNIYSFILSYHNEYTNEKTATDLMKLSNRRCQVNVMVPPEKFDELIELSKRLSENCERYVIPKYLRINMQTELYPYTDEQLQYFQNDGFGLKYYEKGPLNYSGFDIHMSDGSVEHYTNSRKITINKLNRWKGWKCWGGIDAFFIDHGLNIYVGQCRRGKFANLIEDYDLPTQPFICDKDICNCTQDVMETNKEKY